MQVSLNAVKYIMFSISSCSLCISDGFNASYSFRWLMKETNLSRKRN